MPNTVTGTVELPTNATNMVIMFELSRVDLDAVVHVPDVQWTAVDSAGAFSLDLWPNELGLTGTNYFVRLRYERAGGTFDIPLGTVVVPDVATSDLSALLQLPSAIGGLVALPPGGTVGQILVRDPAEPYGLRWADPFPLVP